MRLSINWPRLPWSLFAVSLALTVAALPVESSDVDLLVLTPEDFAPTIAKGTWFIEFFSPYCGHCRQFAPTWKELVAKNQAQANPGIHLAQVNCASHGDLCTKHKVNGYPQLNLYKDGQFAETYRKPRSIEELEVFVKEHAATSSSDHTSTDTSVSHADETPQVEYNPLGIVLPLDEKSFGAAAEAGPLFVKFFAPWCGHCKKLAPHWTRLGSYAQHKLTVAEVNCEDHAALCKKNDVQGYPMLMFLNAGEKTEYTGGRAFDQLKDFVDKAVAPAVQELSGMDELQARVRDSEVVYLFLHSGSDSNLVSTLTQASRSLLGTVPVYISTSSSLFSHFALPSTTPVLLAFKDHDITKPAVTHPLSTPASTNLVALKNYLAAHSLPSALELMQDTFKDVMSAPHHPLVVLVAAKDAQATAGTVKAMGKAWRAKGGEDGKVVFVWMDAHRWASWLKGMYGVKPDEQTAVVIADHANLVYWDTDVRGNKISLTETSVFAALDGVLSGKISSKHSENIVERFARFLNDKLTSIEMAVFHHPWRTALFVIAVLGVVFMAMKRLLVDDVYEPAGKEWKNAKNGRLD